MTDGTSIRCAGESSLIVYLGEHSSPEISQRIAVLAQRLTDDLEDALVDLIPSYASLLVMFNPLVTDHFHVTKQIRACSEDLGGEEASSGDLVEIPVFYHPDSGEDLLSLAADRGLHWEQVAEIHSAQEYRVYAIGFAPGFAYLGDVDKRIAAPRLATPRQKVPRGAVAIADRQTAVYPATSPGGWNLIGRSPMRMFDPDAQPPMPVRTGDRVRFTPIDRATFLDAGGEL